MAGICVLSIRGQEPSTGGEGGTPTEELRRLMSTALTAARQQDEAKLKEIAHGMMIPNYETWFKTTFGEEEGVKMAAAYKESFDRQETSLPKLFEGLPKREGEWLVEEVKEPGIPGSFRCEQVLLEATKKGAKFYRVTFQMSFDGGTKAASSTGFYTLIEGAYRRLDCVGMGLGLLGGVASGGPALGPLRVGGNVQAARIINRVQPVYPIEARNGGISGTVRLHVIVAKDGTMGQIEVVSGHPLLQQAALDAVRQWRYQKTLLNGAPVEVDTTIDLVFALNP